MPSIFDDIDDDLSQIINAPVRSPEDRPALPAHLEKRPVAENCPRCGGRGRIYSYASGRDLGPCFRCKGEKKVYFTNPAEVRAQHRQAAADRKADKEAAALAAFAVDHPSQAAWIEANRAGFEFAQAMRDAVIKFGSLTVNQLGAIDRCINRAAEKRQAADQQRAAASTELDVSKLDAVFAVARANGAKKAAIRAGSVCFSLAPAAGRNPGAIYAKDRSTGTYLGKIADGRFKAAFECTPVHTAAIVEAAADPKAAALRYAAETDECSICGKTLTNPESKRRKIGPTCAAKFGW